MLMYIRNTHVAALALVALASQARADCTPQLPTVDLGYAVHQATYNESGGLFTFSNIRYATAPRFGAPTPVTVVNRTVNDGQTPGNCPMGSPPWLSLSPQYQAGQLSLDEVNATFAGIRGLSPSSDPSLIKQYLNTPITVPASTITEDCLNLDVVVPEKIFKSTNNSSAGGERPYEPTALTDCDAAPVLVWIYGGGYTVGDKNYCGNPATLIAKSQEDGSDGIVYVALNYRLGLFGFISGTEYEEQGGVSNIGLRDQRFALQWVQENIHLFGGDPDNVTVLGESAGAGSILHQLTAYGSTSGAPFRRAILQSPGFEFITGNGSKAAGKYARALEWASYFSNSSVGTLDDLRKLPYDVLDKVNQVTISTAYWGGFGWGPTVDGDFVPDLPGLLLSQGRFDSSVAVLGARNSDEGFIFASPLIEDEEDYLSLLLTPLLPDASDEVVDYITTQLYPAVYDGTHPWTTPLARASATVADTWFICNNYFLNKALGGVAYNYLFDVPPGHHGNDIGYTFFNGETTYNGLPVNASVADTLQAYLTAFAKTGSPNQDGLPEVPLYGDDAAVVSLYNRTTVVDTAVAERCDWWQKAFFI
ncbi:Carboxylic ester hydrolase [Colletotrichum higginsianum IMI 349063]|uniref:Carboxylic ester hydrolase n=1 Tax=Colletotrichum higginsianum (strain IMI 349063) TaxID=759273 RepID=A0A1B7YAX4_COLHI|nr:Carboxylic ester hydrolase [Colletotrichum higginsianum IMI 349063]OBR09222.1 Carboxylic ester hydrolase [Colletotrichum higginsianum IMI 349063]